jgi:hypothetical protein
MKLKFVEVVDHHSEFEIELVRRARSLLRKCDLFVLRPVKTRMAASFGLSTALYGAQHTQNGSVKERDGNTLVTWRLLTSLKMFIYRKPPEAKDSPLKKLQMRMS